MESNSITTFDIFTHEGANDDHDERDETMPTVYLEFIFLLENPRYNARRRLVSDGNFGGLSLSPS